MEAATSAVTAAHPCGPVVCLLARLLAAAVWLGAHWYVLAAAAALTATAGEAVVRRLAARATRRRMAVELVADRHFEPSMEEIFRHGLQLARASAALPWWAPRRARTVQVRLRADGSTPLRYRIEGPVGSERLLSIGPFGPDVTVTKAEPFADEPRTHTVRAEFVLRGGPVASLREVPLEPDPLQPLVDAVSDLDAELGDLAEIRLDIQQAPGWALRLLRRQLLAGEHQAARAQAQRSARWMRRGGADSVLAHLHRQLTETTAGAGSSRRLFVAPTPRRVEETKALGKLAEGDQLLRVQLLVVCQADKEGRAQARLAQVHAALDVFGAHSRWALRGWRLGPWRVGADHWPHRSSFERRWQLGHCQPPRANWIRMEELTGLLKPPTVHCRLPFLVSDLPSFTFGDPQLLLQGLYRPPTGHQRLVATYADETFFEVGVGKAGGGKTERALAQAIGWAHAGGGLMFVDPHRDSWPRAMPFLAHDSLMPRIMLVDLNGLGPSPRVSSWNPIGMQHGRAPHEVVEAITDAYASALGWDDATAPRALTILTAALAVLVAVNVAACRAGRPKDQATLFHVRALVTDPTFRSAALRVADDGIGEETRSWWRSVFPTLSPDACAVVLNPIVRLAANPVTRAFLGQPVGVYDIRTAMDTRTVVWVCPGGSGPTDRLLTALLARDLLRAVRSRRDLPDNERIPFRPYFDELITLTGSAPETIAAMFEDFRKYRVHVLAMLWAAIGFIAGLVVADATLGDTLLSFFVPSLAAYQIAYEIWSGQNKVADERDRLTKVVNTELRHGCPGPIPDDEWQRLRNVARDVQDGVLRTRLDTTRVPEWFYKRFRDDDERDFGDTAEGHRVRLAQITP
ncbi:S-4TM family putative pore-forming effector [Streptomyces fagopyri]|uniref:S-4TM family putative pore-forming effector n=1 Tax=Streptomyces fagopyri TaxID=2662397 RepID=UPI0033E8D4ED